MKRATLILALTGFVAVAAYLAPTHRPAPKVAVFGRTLFPCPPFCEQKERTGVTDWRGVHHKMPL